MSTRSPTVGEHLDRGMPEVVAPGLRPTTVSTYRTAVELYLEPELGDVLSPGGTGPPART